MPRKPKRASESISRGFHLDFDSPEQRQDAHEAARLLGHKKTRVFLLSCIAPQVAAVVPEARERWAAYLPEESA